MSVFIGNVASAKWNFFRGHDEKLTNFLQMWILIHFGTMIDPEVLRMWGRRGSFTIEALKCLESEFKMIVVQILCRL